MQNRKIRELITAAMLIVLGLVLPLFTHTLGAGTVILPMHIPVLLAGLLLPVPYALGVGILSPVLSSLLTGMPPMLPMLPIMVAELAVYAISASLLYRKAKWNLYLALIGAMVLGRIAAGIMVSLLLYVFGVNVAPPLVYLAGAVTAGIPGIVIQIVLIPPIVFAVKKLWIQTEKKRDTARFDARAEQWYQKNQYDMKKIAQMLDRAGEWEGKTVCDVGCGTGVLLKEIQQRGAKKIVAMDLSPKMLEEARRRNGTEGIEYRNQDIDRAADREVFDLIVCYNLWPHLYDPARTLRQIGRMLKPGGKVLIAHTSPREEVIRRHRKHRPDEEALPAVSELKKRRKSLG